MKRLWLALMVGLGAMPSAFAKAPTAKLDLATCRAPASGLPENLAALLGEHAKTYAPYAVICPVVNSRGVEVLKILALREDEAAAANHLYFIHGKPWDGVNGALLHDAGDPVPNPIVLTAGDKAVGTLPEPLFSDGPGDTTISFGDWHGDMPGRISTRVDNAGVLQTFCPPPLVWNAARGRYVALPGEEFGACPKQP
ncbi:hypothetical protein [Dyella mobilis]|uniref:Uncharacterized protein n=1 Tax=Dyella mobilis TaxID=1849582 RepID=A0ABS2KJ74_9GAMM|nr:hypothetical protein [Dyella mobilis]MBM7130978.1 hypothetical protein [Dyella mobilis]GLQ97607.1 hypothetical protein GCM10007863_20270 [Dyella mobilis]